MWIQVHFTSILFSISSAWHCTVIFKTSGANTRSRECYSNTQRYYQVMLIFTECVDIHTRAVALDYRTGSGRKRLSALLSPIFVRSPIVDRRWWECTVVNCWSQLHSHQLLPIVVQLQLELMAQREKEMNHEETLKKLSKNSRTVLFKKKTWRLNFWGKMEHSKNLNFLS